MPCLFIKTVDNYYFFAKNGGVGKQSHLLIPLGTREWVAQLIFVVGKEHTQLFFHYCILHYHCKCSLTLLCFFCINRNYMGASQPHDWSLEELRFWYKAVVWWVNKHLYVYFGLIWKLDHVSSLGMFYLDAQKKFYFFSLGDFFLFNLYMKILSTSILPSLQIIYVILNTGVILISFWCLMQ
jgi:hypothetical protein